MVVDGYQQFDFNGMGDTDFQIRQMEENKNRVGKKL